MSPANKKKSKAATSRRTPKKVAKKKLASRRASKKGEPKKTEVKIALAKGRPMLTWVGKHPLQRVTAFPAQLVEKFDPLGEQDKKQAGGLLFHGDNKEVLAYLLANGHRGKVNLIYIDPPFDSGADYVRKIELRGIAGTAKVGAESYTLGEQVQYSDIWANDNYLQFMYERLLLLKELMASNGSIFLHCDYRKVHHLRAVMDEIFGDNGFVNEVIWLAEGGGASGLRFGRKHQTLLYYSKASSDTERTFNGDAVRVAYKTENIQPQTYHFDANLKKRPGFKEGYTWVPHEAGKIPTDAWLDCFLEESEGVPLDIWYDVKGLYGPSGELESYPTQKPEALLTRVIRACSNPNDLILDCFVGSGTTADVAQKLGRRWIGCDINKGAIQATTHRLMTTIREQIHAKDPAQRKLLPAQENEQSKPSQFSFSANRVNDYDLQIQHNEAVNLACEHIGIKRTKSDSFFEGELGKKLVKIIPFNHPLSPLDLEEIKNELAARPDEDRDIAVVSLGKELAVDGWLEEWNRYRKQKGFPNKIEVIELRTDERYGKFFEHKPAKARVDIKRDGGKIKIRIREFISPTILERLEQQAGVLTPHIEDWRSMVDSVMIDTAYDGKVLNVTYADVPERKNDLVVGEYELDVPKKKTTVAVKITDMLGEEVLTTIKL